MDKVFVKKKKKVLGGTNYSRERVDVNLLETCLVLVLPYHCYCSYSCRSDDIRRIGWLGWHEAERRWVGG